MVDIATNQVTNEISKQTEFCLRSWLYETLVTFCTFFKEINSDRSFHVIYIYIYIYIYI